MNIIYILLPLALIIVIIFLISFFWAVKNGQYDNLETDKYRPLLDDD
jgi:cbb3-type cytochrome oxidase maturation protein